MILSTDQKIKLKQLFENKKFSEIEYFVESLGDVKKLPTNILNIYEIDLNNAEIDLSKNNGEVNIKVIKDEIAIDTTSPGDV